MKRRMSLLIASTCLVFVGVSSASARPVHFWYPKDLWENADLVVITDIYSAGESNPSELSGQQVVDVVKAYHPHVYYAPYLAELPEFLAELLQPGDLTLFLGAGNLNQKIPETILAYTNSCVQELAKAG